MAEADCTCVCDSCGSAFKPTTNKDGSIRKTAYRACSKACRRKLSRSVEKQCACCGNAFSPTKRLTRHCSSECLAMDAASRGKPVFQRECVVCSSRYVTVRPEAKHCSRKCARRTERLNRSYGPFYCGECHKPFMRRDNRRDSFCSRECCFAHREKMEREVLWVHLMGMRSVSRIGNAASSSARLGAIRRRSSILKRQRDSIDPIKVFERDGWRCHICKVKTDRRLRGTVHPGAPELDHIVTIKEGGSHTWGNVACACRRCNQSKGSASFGQLGIGFAV